MRLTLLLDMAADAFGDRVVAGPRAGGITAAGLAARSHSGAGLIRERGAQALVYLDVNGPAFPVALFAAARAGVPLVPLNYRLGQEQLDACWPGTRRRWGSRARARSSTSRGPASTR